MLVAPGIFLFFLSHLHRFRLVQFNSHTCTPYSFLILIWRALLHFFFFIFLGSFASVRFLSKASATFFWNSWTAEEHVSHSHQSAQFMVHRIVCHTFQVCMQFMWWLCRDSCLSYYTANTKRIKKSCKLQDFSPFTNTNMWYTSLWKVDSTSTFHFPLVQDNRRAIAALQTHSSLFTRTKKRDP